MAGPACRRGRTENGEHEGDAGVLVVTCASFELDQFLSLHLDF